MATKIQLTLVRSYIGCTETQRATLRALGLRKMHQSVLQTPNESLDGQINKVRHLVKVAEVNA